MLLKLTKTNIILLHNIRHQFGQVRPASIIGNRVDHLQDMSDDNIIVGQGQIPTPKLGQVFADPHFTPAAVIQAVEHRVDIEMPVLVHQCLNAQQALPDQVQCLWEL